MVMHARKFPRLDDGYYDRSQPHLMEDKQLNISRGKYDRYASKRDIPGIDGFCGHSPSLQPSPRYANKTGHGDRKMDKDRGSSDRRSEDARQNSHGYKDARNKDQKLKDHKAEVHKLAEKVCGDWSEHVSSSGKRYYYNSTTEVSQWERPEEWVEASVLSSSSRTPRTKDASEKSTSTGHKGQRDWSKHSVGNHNSTKGTPVSNSQLNSRLTANNSTKTDGLLVEDCHRTDVAAAATNVSSRPHGSNATPSSKTSSEGSTLAANDDSSHGNSRSFETVPFGDRTPRGDGGAGATASSPSRVFGTPVGPNGIYGLFASGGGVPSSNDYHHHHQQQQQHHQRSRISDSVNPDAYKCDDMDISPGSTPTEESMLEKHASATKTSNAAAVASTPVSTPLSLEQPGSVTPLASLTPTLLSCASAVDKSSVIASSSTSVTNATILSTLAALQQAVSQITVDKAPGLAATTAGNVQQPQATSLISCLALLPPLISQLNVDKSTNSQMRPQDRQQNAQIMKQAIELLQKLQQALVAQQQLQQQRQLQQLLLQLLSVQKSSGRPATSSSSQWTTPPQPKRVKVDSSSTVEDDDKSESPYSPPDSDGTPLGSPDAQPRPSMAARLPIENAANVHRQVSKPDETDAESTRHPCSNPINMASAVQPVTLGTSQLAAATVHRKQDSTGLTPSLANFFNSQLIEHAAGWQSDLLERQADCFAEEAHTIGSIHCTQVSVELKRARSMVRANEIKATLHEQRIMSLCQRHRELEQGFSLFMPLQDT